MYFPNNKTTKTQKENLFDLKIFKEFLEICNKSKVSFYSACAKQPSKVFSRSECKIILWFKLRVSNWIFVKLLTPVHMYFSVTDGPTCKPFVIWASGVLFLLIQSIYIKAKFSISSMYINCPCNKYELAQRCEF